MKVLFICTANSCRSQMAEAWAHRLFPAGWEASSAGLITYPITARTRAAMAEAGLDMAGQRSKPIDDFDLDAFDLVVTLSREAGTFLPVLGDPARHRPRPIPDPMSAEGDEATRQAAFAAGRETVRRIVEEIIEDFATD